MAERNSLVVSMRMPIAEYERLRARALVEKRTVGGLALELLRKGGGRSKRLSPQRRSR